MNLQGFEIRHLAILDMLFTERHVGRAAERLHLSQPAVSNTLSWLRRYFDDPLLVRGGGGLRLTPFAESLCDPVRALLVEFRVMAGLRPVFDPPTATNRFRIIMSDYPAAMLLPRLLRLVAEAAPGVRIDYVRVQGDVNAFPRGEIDLLILPWQVLHAGHPREPLFSDEWVCVAGTGEDTPETLDEAAFVRAGHVIADLPQPVPDLRPFGVELAIRATVPFSLLPEAVIGTPWLATVPRGLVQRRAGLKALRLFPIPFAVGPLVIAQQWRAEANDDPASLWLRAMVRAAVAAEGGQLNAEVAASLMRNDRDQQR